MEIILSPRCQSFTGTISRYHGYAIRRSGKRFFSYRTTGKHAKPDGHWKFILSCAELSKLNLHISDISVSGKEVEAALVEAGLLHRTPHRLDSWKMYNAADVLSLRERSGL